MSRIVQPNGLPVGIEPRLAMPNQVDIQIGVGPGPQGPILAITIGGQTINVPMPPPLAVQVGVSLIQTAGQYVQRQAAEAQPGPAEDLLAESMRKVGGA